MAYRITVTPLSIDLLKADNRLAHEAGRLSIEERTKRALAKGEALLAEASRAANRKARP